MKEIGYEERAKYYEKEYRPLDDTDFIQTFFQNISTALIIPVGNARYINAFKNYSGLKIDFADIQSEVIDTVLFEIREKKLEHMFFAYTADIITFKAHTLYDLIVVPQEAFQLFNEEEDVLRIIKNLKSNIQQDGKIIIDIAFFKKGENAFKPKYYSGDLDNKILFEWKTKIKENIWMFRFRKEKISLNTVTFTFFYTLRDDKYNLIQRSKAQVKMRKYKIDEILRLFKESELVVEYIYGGYDFHPFSDLDHRMIFILKKK